MNINPTPFVRNQFIQEILADSTSDIDLEMRINETARRILTSSSMSKDEKQEAWGELLRFRTTYLQHVPVNALKGSVIFFNMKQIGLAPTPLCPAYNKMRCPTISSYNTIGSNIAIILLDPSAIKHVPMEILEKTGNLSGKEVDLMFTIVDGRPFVNLDRPINLCTHPWSHPHALTHDWVEYDVNMGIFPEIGFQPGDHNDSRSVAYNDIRPMWVHTHYDHGAVLYSPDNAHFQITPKSPFGILWSVTQKNNRIAITKMVVIFNYDHPICLPLVESTRGCNNLETHLKGQEETQKEIHKTFLPIITSFKNNDPITAMAAFNKLPLSFQFGIYKEAWLLANCPRDVHKDFGKASFENDPSLEAKFHCSNLNRAQVIANFGDRLIDLLVKSETALTEESQALTIGDDTLKMMQCAQLLAEGLEKDAMELFHQFSQSEQENVFLAIWEVSKCPRGSMSFGKDTFLNPKTPLKIKTEALLLAASRQSSKFEPSIIPIIEKAPIHNDIIITNKPEPSCIPNPQPSNVEPPAIEIIDTTSSITLQNTPQTSSIMTPQEVLKAMIALAFDSQDFLSSGITNQRSVINKLFNHLPIDIKNQIYGRVYEYSVDPNKGGPNWGENHVADDLNVLIYSLQDSILES